jgi:tRNA U34 2-thiouridine synthase MnmA/TrmU
LGGRTLRQKAVSLLSGGLDSLIATKIIVEQGIKVEALHFTSPFCTCSKGNKGCGIQAVRSAKELGIEVNVRTKGLEYLEIVKKPRHGYGRAMNPCIDCRIFMLKHARQFMDEIGASFIITGEVLGQRPMSQRRDTIKLIERESGLEDLIVRPLSAKHFPPTIPEQEGIVNREKLFGITGRSRKGQYDFVHSHDLTEFSCPGGGCLLTDPIFARKLKDLFTYQPEFTMQDVALLKIGRHFRLDKKTKLVLGRNHDENNRLSAFHEPPSVLLSPVGFKGPVGLMIGTQYDDSLKQAANLMAYYGKSNSSPVTVKSINGTDTIHVVERQHIDIDNLII